MKKFLFECDFENGTERFNVVGLDLDHILAMVTGTRAVLVWAWNALHTERFAHDVFSGDYGPDFSALRGQPYTEEVRAAEAIRIVRETLMINPYITDVTQVSAEFSGSTLALRFKLTTIYGEVGIDGCDITL